eukprot:COSAG02_NODE_13_length_57813_cov_14.298276_25_plen_76_part_00
MTASHSSRARGGWRPPSSLRQDGEHQRARARAGGQRRGATRRYLMLSAASLFGAEVPFRLKVLFFCFLMVTEVSA